MRICIFEGCERKHDAHGYCSAHHRQMKRNGFVKPIQVVKFDCNIAGCDGAHKAKGYCAKHYKMGARYGIEPERYEEMRNEQDGKCAICFSVKELVVDHNHDTGEIRSLLCHLCNRALGFLQDDFNIVSNAAEYLKKWKEEK